MGDGLQLEIDNVGFSYSRRNRRESPFVAVNDISLSVRKGEAFGIVGESGAGKSTLARCVVGLQVPTSGAIRFEGEQLDPRRNPEQRRAIQMVFQDPYASLNPRMTVGSMMVELLRVHGLAPDRAKARAMASTALERVALPASVLDQRPGAFSGGQRQRIAIARALLLRPRLLVADEPASALDVSVQATILMLLRGIQREFGLTILFISHDLAVVHQFCHRAAVMKQGQVVESGTISDLFARPCHPYTRELLAAATQLPPLEVIPLDGDHAGALRRSNLNGATATEEAGCEFT